MNNTVRWLCATAGAEVVGKPEVAQALLSPSMAMTADKLGAPRGGERNGLRWWAWESLASQLARAGETVGTHRGRLVGWPMLACFHEVSV